MLAAEWTHRLPIIQQSSPADMAASLIVKALDEIADGASSKITVVDFCSGGGGMHPPPLKKITIVDTCIKALCPSSKNL